MDIIKQYERALVNNVFRSYGTIQNYCDNKRPSVEPIVGSLVRLLFEELKSPRCTDRDIIIDKHLNSISNFEIQLDVTLPEMQYHLSWVNKSKTRVTDN